MDRCNGIFEVISVETVAVDLVTGDRRLFQKAVLIPRHLTPVTAMGPIQLQNVEGDELHIGDHFELTLERMRPQPVASTSTPMAFSRDDPREGEI